MRTRLPVTVAALGLLLGSAASGASQVTVSAPVPLSPFQVGDSIPIAIQGNFSTSILASSFTVTFDPAMFSVNYVVVDPLFIDAALPPPTFSIDNVAGTVTTSELVNLAGAPVNTDFTFLYISGVITAAGTFDVGFTSQVMFDLNGNLLEAGRDFTVVPATVSSVPVPAALWLFGSGLLALVGFGRRRISAR